MAQLPGKQPHATASISQPSLLRIYGLQCLLLLGVCAALLFAGPVTAYSALIGGSIALVPNAYFARQVFRYRGAQSAGAIARSLYRGEVGKFVMTAILFAGVFMAVEPLQEMALFAAFLAMVLINTVFAARIGSRRAGVSQQG